MTRKKCKGRNRDGSECKSPFVMDNGYCQAHGGKAPRGPANGSYKHGRYSKYAPAGRLTALYEQALADGNIKDLTDSIALLDGMINESLENLESIGGPDFFKDLSKIGKELYRAYDKQDLEGVFEAAINVEGMAMKGLTYYKATDNLTRLIEQRRRQTDSLVKHEHDQEQTMTVTQTLMIINKLVEIIITHVHSPHTRKAITDDLQSFIVESRLAPYPVST